jgi:solute carrier family 35 (UDP-xylose/UDP-N-acetylglucosamine transporter), member B4
MLFITAQQLPSFITWDKSSSSFPLRFKPRQVPITQWLLQVTTFASGTLLNNIVFAFNVPPTIQIVFRSAGKLLFAFPRPSRLFLVC